MNFRCSLNTGIPWFPWSSPPVMPGGNFFPFPWAPFQYQISEISISYFREESANETESQRMRVMSSSSPTSKTKRPSFVVKKISRVWPSPPPIVCFFWLGGILKYFLNPQLETNDGDQQTRKHVFLENPGSPLPRSPTPTQLFLLPYLFSSILISILSQVHSPSARCQTPFQSSPSPQPRFQ